MKPGLRGPGLTLITTLAILVAGPNPSAVAEEGPATLQGPYLGQPAPGATPELFAPGVVSREDHFEHSTASFSPDLSEVYWSAKPNDERYYRIYFVKMNDDGWTAPKIASFLAINSGERGPVVSPDGSTIYFDVDGDIWRVEKRGDGWSEPAVVSEVSHPTLRDRVCSVAEDGSVFFRRGQSTPEGCAIYVARMTGEGLSVPEKLDKDFPSEYKIVGDIFLAPDQSYMILELHADRSTSELFVSYRLRDGSWSEEIKLPLGWGRFPSVSPDGKYIFFMRREGIYWADAAMLENLRPAGAQ